MRKDWTHLYGSVMELGHLGTLVCMLWVDMIMMMPYCTYVWFLRSCAYPWLLIFVPRKKWWRWCLIRHTFWSLMINSKIKIYFGIFFERSAHKQNSKFMSLFYSINILWFLIQTTTKKHDLSLKFSVVTKANLGAGYNNSSWSYIYFLDGH